MTREKRPLERLFNIPQALTPPYSISCRRTVATQSVSKIRDTPIQVAFYEKVIGITYDGREKTRVEVGMEITFGKSETFETEYRW